MRARERLRPRRLTPLVCAASCLQSARLATRSQHSTSLHVAHCGHSRLASSQHCGVRFADANLMDVTTRLERCVNSGVGTKSLQTSELNHMNKKMLLFVKIRNALNAFLTVHTVQYNTDTINIQWTTLAAPDRRRTADKQNSRRGSERNKALSTLHLSY